MKLMRMKRLRRIACGGALALVAAVAAAGPAAAGETPTVTPASECPAQEFSQAFSSVKDKNWYTLMYGQSVDRFDGTGWTFSGGAGVAPATLTDGTDSTVLDLPAGSSAESPPICITKDYPKARAVVRGGKDVKGVEFHVSYAGTRSWDEPRNTGQFNGHGEGWSAADPVDLHPYKVEGYQTVRFILTPADKARSAQLYNLYIDPHRG